MGWVIVLPQISVPNVERLLMNDDIICAAVRNLSDREVVLLYQSAEQAYLDCECKRANPCTHCIVVMTVLIQKEIAE